MATRATSPASRPGRAAALAIAARTAARRSEADASAIAAAVGSGMSRRQPLPRLWLMTDERPGGALWAALGRLPRGSGIVVRHYRLSKDARRALFQRVRSIARRRGLLLLLAGSESEALAWGDDGSHGRGSRSSPGRLRSAPAHDVTEIRA